MLNLDNLLINEYFDKIKGLSFFENLENFHILIILSGFLFLIIFIIFYFFLFQKNNKSIGIDNNKNKPTLNDIVNDTDKSTKLDIVKPQPRYAVLTSASRPDAQKSLKKIGKKAAITVVANAELPPS